MEQQVKDRLVGAAVLVAVAVALIPELLSGRKTIATEAAPPPVAGRRTLTIELGEPAALPVPAGPASAGAPRATLQLPTPTDETVVEMAPPEASPPAAANLEGPQGLPLASSAVDDAPPPAPAVVAGTAGAAGLVVQVGAFGSEQAAQKLVLSLQGKGYQAFVAPLQRDGKMLHRVRVGPAPDRGAAAALAERLKQEGLPATVVGGA